MDPSNQVAEFVKQWFVTETGRSSEDLERQLDVNYFVEKWVDSFKFISFVSVAETRFDFRFTNEDFQDEDFGTIRGLIGTIERHLA
ncbi:MAG: hypothetical protein V1745_00730 [Patescibacteria group bacterium]